MDAEVDALAGRIQALPGRLAVLMDEAPTPGDTDVILPRGVGEQLEEWGLRRRALQRATVVSSGTELRIGDRVWVLPGEGLTYYEHDAEWVPEGREVRFYRSSRLHKTDWRNDVLGVVKE